jgi:isopentenyl diphosphate isomerase/L-lactate dehydrogenase-like FMN-dependent dehydrogenase
MQVEIDRIIESGVDWLGLEVDAGMGTKVREREMGFECRPLTRAEIEHVKTRIPIPLVCKGILSREDAAACMDAGADILVVSNHGGHTLDYLPHAFQVMDEIVAEVNGRATVIVDGGLRRGGDILKALAFGATLAGLGRPILYALAAGGEAAVPDLINAITRELQRLMTLVGCPDPAAVRRDILIEDRP